MTDTNSQLPDTVPARHYAAMVVAIGWLRGELHRVLMGDINQDQIRRVLDATAMSAIAEAIGKEEADLAIDWDLYLSQSEKHTIGGIS